MLWNFKPVPLNPPHRGTFNKGTEKLKRLLVLSPTSGEIERGFGNFQQLLIKERNNNVVGS